MIGKIEELANSHIIVGGDFNFVFNIKMDKLNGNATTNFKCRNIITNWMKKPTSRIYGELKIHVKDNTLGPHTINLR